ncbi:MAG: hypothetical protein ACM3N4_04580 [Nitrososphaerota archaeon]
MNQHPFITIPLRDGTQASVGHDGVRVGERTFAVADVQDARQVAPDPLTIALRVANERHGVELQPARPDDGALFLEALFRLRPELRPAGFDPPDTVPEGFPPLPAPASAGGQPGMPNPWETRPGWAPYPGMYPPAPGTALPPPAPPLAQAPPGYAPPNAAGGRLSPYPRRVSELIAAAFELFIAHWRRWLLLGVVTLFLPHVIQGAVDALFRVLSGSDLWAGLPPATSGNANSAFGVSSADLTSGNGLLLTAFDLLITSAIGAVIGGWSAAVLGIAARNALFGRAPGIGAALRAGLKRTLPAIGANVLNGLILLLILLPLIVVYGIILSQFGAAIADPNALDPTSSAAMAFTLLGCLALILLVPCGIFAIYVMVRLIPSPYIAATEQLGPVAALRKSWSLTHRQWWHTCVPLFVASFLAAVIAFPASFVEYASYGVAVLAAIPLAGALVAPLVAIATIVVLYDLRLRREGFAQLASETNEGNKSDRADEPLPTQAPE